MKKKFIIKTLSLLMVVAMLSILLVVLTSCIDMDPDGLDYGEPDGTTADRDSWTQIDPNDEDVEITWYIDATSWDTYQIADLIYERTGVKVKFQKALKADGTELSTMVAGNKLPDIITITDYTTRSQLAQEGYAYALDKLAENYAPSLLSRISADYTSYFKAEDGHIYGYMNNYFSEDDLEAYGQQGGHIRSLYSIAVRQDYLNAYLAHKVSQDASYNVNKAFKANDFIEMCLWVKDEYNLPDGSPTVLLSDFPQTPNKANICSSLSCVMDMFAVPREDSDGNFLYQYEQEGALESLQFLNALFRNGLVTTSNFGYSVSDLTQQIQNGTPVAFIGRVEEEIVGFAKYAQAGYNAETNTIAEQNKYVNIVVTNANGDAPTLIDKSGRGLRYTMITNNCKRVDRVIKMFDYLISEQGNRECYYGKTEGEYYNFVVRPGETVTDENGNQITYKYGQIEWTQKAKDLLGPTSGAGWYSAGLKQISLLCNPLYGEMTSVYGVSMDTFQWWNNWDMHCGMTPYVFSKTPWDFDADTSDDKYIEMATLRDKMEYEWVSALPVIIMAGSADDVELYWGKTVKKLKNMGLDSWVAYQNVAFKNSKATMGISYAWPKADPNYVAPAVTLLGEYDKYKIPMPDFYKFN